MSTSLQTTRLAPSPTGALHLGNARTFLVNWALARRQGWRIVLRIEDLDGPRIKPGAAAACMETLRWLGIDWDEGPHVQSDDLQPYRSAMTALSRAGLIYPSLLSRSDVEDASSAPQEGVHESRFPPELRPSIESREFDDETTNWRFVTPAVDVTFNDDFTGEHTCNPARSVGDFLVWTKRAQPSYQLAVVVDDARHGVTQIVRGDDLLDSAARQLLLMRALGITPEPTYTHLPLIRGEDGRRLAKRHGDTRVDSYRSAGVPPERIVGLLAFWCGMIPSRRAMSAGDFASGLDLRTIPRNAVTFTHEDDAWLRSRS